MSKKKAFLTIIPALHLFSASALVAQQPPTDEKKGKILTYNREILEDKKQKSHHTLSLALNAKAEGNYSLARKLYGSVLKTINPSDYPPDFTHDIYLNLAEINFDLKDYPEAVKIVDFIEKQKLSQTSFARAQFLRANLFLKAQDKESAFFTLALLHQKHHNSKWPGPMKALYLSLRDEMEKSFDEMISKAERNYAIGNYEQSEKEFREILEAIDKELFAPPALEAITAKVRLRIAENAYLTGNFDGIVDVLEQMDPETEFIPSLRPFFYEGKFLLGQAHNRLGNKELAQNAFEDYLKSETYENIPFKKEVVWELSKLYFEKRDYSKATEYLTRTLRTNGFSKEQKNLAKLRLSHLYVETGKTRQAKVLLNSLNETLTKTSPRRKEWAFLAGKVYYLSKDYPSAIKQFEAALAKGSEQPSMYEVDSLKFLGKIYLEEWEKTKQPLHLVKAENYLKRVHEFEEPTEETLLQLGKIIGKKSSLFKQKTDEEKVHELLSRKNGLKTTEGYAQGLLVRAKASTDRGQKQALLRELITSHPTSSKYPEALLMLGKEELKDARTPQAFDEAVAKLEDALHYLKGKNPGKATKAFLDVHTAKLFQSPAPNFQEAFTSLQRADTEYPELKDFLDEEPYYDYLLGISAYNYSKSVAGKEKQSLVFLAKQALTSVSERKVSPELMEKAYFNLGALYFEDGNYYEAKRNFLAHANTFPESKDLDKSYYFAGQSSLQMKDPHTETSALFEKVYQSFPSSPFADEAYFFSCSSKAYELGDVKALAHLEKMNGLYPESPYMVNASFYLGKNYLKQALGYKEKGINDTAEITLKKAARKFEEAISYFDYFSEQNRAEANPLLAKAWQESSKLGGETYFHLAELSQADKRLHYLRKSEGLLSVYSNESGDYSADLLLSKVYTSLNDFTPAIKHLQNVIANSPNGEENNALLLALADLNYRHGNLNSALTYTKNALEKSDTTESEQRQAYLLAGLVFVSLDQEEEALEVLESLQDMGISGSNWDFFQGKLAQLRQDYNSAVNFFKRALNGQENLLREQDCRFEFAKSLFQAGKEEENFTTLVEAEKGAKRLWLQEPNEQNTLLLADILKVKFTTFQREEDAEALNRLLSHEEIFNSEATLAKALWDRLEVASDEDQKFAIYSRLAKLEDKESDAFGKVMLELGTRELKRAQGDTELLELAQTHLKRTFEQLKETQPEQAFEALLGYVEALVQTKRREDTLLALQTIYNLEQDHPRLIEAVSFNDRYHYVRGLAAAEASKESMTAFSGSAELPLLAKSAFEEVIENYPESTYLADSYFYLGKVSIELSLFDEAMNHFTLLTEKIPDDYRTPEALFYLAKLSQFRGHSWDETRNYLERIYTGFPQSPLAEKAYFEVFSKKDYYTSREALVHLAGFSSRFPSSPINIEASYILGRAHQSLGAEQNSPKLLRKAANYFQESQERFATFDRSNLSDKAFRKYAYIAKAIPFELTRIDQSMNIEIEPSAQAALQSLAGKPTKGSKDYLDQLLTNAKLSILDGEKTQALSLLSEFTEIERSQAHYGYDEALLEKGNIEFALGRFEEARKTFKRTLAAGAIPIADQRDASLKFGFACLETQSEQQLPYIYTQINQVENFPSEKQGDALFLLGNYHLTKDSYALAGKLFEKALENPTFARSNWRNEALSGQALALFETGDNKMLGALEKAEQILETLGEEITPTDAVLGAKISLSKFQLNQDPSEIDKALAYLSSPLIIVDDRLGEKILEVAKVHSNSEQNVALLTVLTTQSAGESPLFNQGLLELAKAYYENGESFENGYLQASGKAISAFEGFQNYDIENAKKAYLLAQKSRLKEGSTQTALTVFEDLTDMKTLPTSIQEALREDEETLLILADSAESLLDSPFLAAQDSELIVQEGAKAIARYLDTTPPNANTLSILHQFAKSAYQQGNLELADPLLSYFVEASETVDLEDQSLVSDSLYLAWMTKEKLFKPLEETKRIKERLYQEFPESSYSDEAYYLTFNESDYAEGNREAISHLEGFPSRFPESPLIVKAHHLLSVNEWKNSFNKEDSLALLENARSHSEQAIESINRFAPELARKTESSIEDAKTQVLTSLKKQAGYYPAEVLQNITVEKAILTQDPSMISEVLASLEPNSEIPDAIGSSLLELSRKTGSFEDQNALLTALTDRKNQGGKYYSRALFEKGMLELSEAKNSRGELEEALNTLKEACQRLQTSDSVLAEKVYLELQKAQIQDHSVASAETVFNNLASLSGLTPAIQNNLRESPERASLIVEASEVLLSEAEFSGEELERIFEEGSSALSLLIRKESLSPGELEFVYTLGVKLFENDFYDSSASLLQAYSELTDDLQKGEEGLYLAWQSLEKLGASEETIQSIKRELISRFPSSQYAASAAYTLFSETTYRNRTPEAINHLENLVKSYPDHPVALRAHLFIGKFYQRKAQVAKTPDDKRQHLERAFDHFSLSESMYDNFKSRVSLPEDAKELAEEATLEASKCQIDISELSGSEKNLNLSRSYLKKIPYDSLRTKEALQLLAKVEQRLGDYEEVVRVLKRLKPLATTSEEKGQILYDLGDAYHRFEIYESALECFKEARKVSGGNVSPALIDYRIGELSVALGAYSSALESLERAIEQSDDEKLKTQATYLIGVVYREKGDAARSKKTFEEIATRGEPSMRQKAQEALNTL